MTTAASPVLFETSRLQVRRIEPSDVDALHAVYGDADAMRWVGNGKPLERAQCEEWVTVTQRNYAARGYGMFALVERSTGEVVGFCGLVHPGGQPLCEIKYALRREAWGKGFASEAATALLAYGATAFRLDKIVASTAPAHTASQRVLEKAGMQKAGLRHNDDGSDSQLFETDFSPLA